jgi:CubicO group peptidase (beta-lactamase class C family)
MKKFVLLLLLLPLLARPVLGQRSPARVDLKKLDRYYEQVVRDWELPGMTVGIVKDGQLIFSKGYGVKEVGKREHGPGDMPDGNTLYAIASNSKAFTSAIMAMLVQEGKLSWNDKVKTYLPYFELYDPYISQEVTIRDLLSHRVGLGTFSGDLLWYKSELSAEEIIKRVKNLPKAYDFRSGYGYTNVMYVTAGEVIAQVTGKSWSQNVQERILTPLGMERTLASISQLEGKENVATPHARLEGKNEPIPWVNWDAVAATGGLISSVNDVAKWMIFNLNHGIHKGDTLLRPASRNLIWTPHNNFVVDHTRPNDLNRNFSSYGLGWDISDFHGRLRVGHTGGYDGMITAISLLPDENIGVVVLTNGTKSPITAVSHYTLEALLGVKGKDWSALQLERVNNWEKEDTRIADLKSKRVADTNPSLALTAYAGTYRADTYGDIRVSLEEGQLKLAFAHSPDLAARLQHWHGDVWEIRWEKPQAWFSFGLLQFTTDMNLEVSGLAFTVPNDDFHFEEMKARRVRNLPAAP